MGTLMTPSERLGTAKAQMWLASSDIEAILTYHSGIPQHTQKALREIKVKLSSAYDRIDRSYE
ncbi:hypothetical protein AB0C87_24825 [Actinomadura sp. NPDC048021]|uniref:hypothetical protein n=1 Tax=Actinomadura sp. NPDC048021 TaxID=3155385 RepID=UPI0033C855FF